MKRVWAIVLAFLLVVGMIASVKVLASILATIVGGTVTVVDTSWWNNDWSYRKLITVNHSYVGSDLTNFPTLIYEIDPDLANHAQSDFDDVCFVTWDNSIKLDHEIEDYNSSTGYIVTWVRINLTATSDTKFWMYYGNSGCGSQQNPTGVWDSNFVMVQHLNETSGTHYDSTQNGNNGTISGSVNQDATGVIDGADELGSGTWDGVEITHNDSLNTPDCLSFEIWVNRTTTGVWQAIVRKSGSWAVDISDSETIRLYLYVPAGDYMYSTATVPVGEWVYIACTWNGTDMAIYINGEEEVEGGHSGTLTTNGNPVGVGYICDEGYGLQSASIDEARISNTVRNANWLNATYWTTHSPSSFYSIGSEEGN